MLPKVISYAVVGLDGALVDVDVDISNGQPGSADHCTEDPAYNLPIAVGFLLATEQTRADLSRTLIIAELSLDGAVRHTNGVLPMAALTRKIDPILGMCHQATRPEPRSCLI